MTQSWLKYLDRNGKQDLHIGISHVSYTHNGYRLLTKLILLTPIKGVKGG